MDTRKNISVLIVSDHVVGHLRQCEAVAHCVVEHYAEPGAAAVRLETVELRKVPKPGRRARFLFALMHPRSGRCAACERCVARAVSPADLRRLKPMRPDIVVTPFGKRTTLVARWFAARSGAQTIVVMNPRSFRDSYDLVVMHRHDVVELGPNMVVTEGAPNAVRPRAQTAEARALAAPLGRDNIAWLIGGDYKSFELDPARVDVVAEQIAQAAAELHAGILITTSRRTPKPIEEKLKARFAKDPLCRLLILAKEQDRPEAVPAILSASRFVVVSPESVSMVSEAASSDAHTLVWQDEAFLDEDHTKFLNNLREKGYVHVVPAERIGRAIVELGSAAKAKRLDDASTVRQALKRVLRD